MKLASGLHNSGLALANSMAALASAFVTYRLVSRFLGVEAFGLWALTSAALFPLRFADLSINSAVLRYLGASHGRGLRRVIGQIVAAALGINLAAFVGFLAVAALLSPAILRGTLDPARLEQGMALIPYMVVAALMQLVAGVFLNAMLGLRRYRAVYLVGVGVALLQVATVLPLILRLGVAGYSVVQTLGYLVQTAIFGAALWRYREEGEGDRRAEFAFRPFVAFALKLNFNSILTMVSDPLTKLLLGRSGPLAVVGIFEMVTRIYAQARGLALAPLQPSAIAMIRDYAVSRSRFLRQYRASLLYAVVIVAAFALSAAPAWLFFKVGMALNEPWLPPIVIAGALIVAANFIAIPAYNACIAASEVRPLLASTISYLVVVGMLGTLLGYTVGWSGVLIAATLGTAFSSWVLIAGCGRLLHFPTFGSRKTFRREVAIWMRLTRRGYRHWRSRGDVNGV